jgi:ABC-type multidrug transport system fused ATPase/permease subunit
MARAILCNAKVVLMDEATASVDLETDALIQHAIEKAFKNKTVIIIAHRLETLKRADKILVLSQGSLLDCGNAKAILEKYSGDLREHMI